MEDVATEVWEKACMARGCRRCVNLTFTTQQKHVMLFQGTAKGHANALRIEMAAASLLQVRFWTWNPSELRFGLQLAICCLWIMSK